MPDRLTATARCLAGCELTGDDPAAAAHTKKTGHATAVVTEQAENALIALAVTTCRAELLVHAADPDIEAGPVGVLTCSMAVHDGLVHYDPVDGAFWLAAQKGMTRDQAETIARRIREAMAA